MFFINNNATLLLRLLLAHPFQCYILFAILRTTAINRYPSSSWLIGNSWDRLLLYSPNQHYVIPVLRSVPWTDKNLLTGRILLPTVPAPVRAVPGPCPAGRCGLPLSCPTPGEHAGFLGSWRTGWRHPGCAGNQRINPLAVFGRHSLFSASAKRLSPRAVVPVCHYLAGMSHQYLSLYFLFTI